MFSQLLSRGELRGRAGRPREIVEGGGRIAKDGAARGGWASQDGEGGSVGVGPQHAAPGVAGWATSDRMPPQRRDGAFQLKANRYNSNSSPTTPP